MDVRCAQCGTEYELDGARLGPGTVTVRCTACGHVFPISQAGAASAQIEAPPREGLTPSNPGDWLVRTEGGHLVSFRELTTLQKWIVEGRVARGDEISKNGETWKRLGNISELEPFFSVYEKAQTLSEPPTGRAEPAPSVSPPRPGEGSGESAGPPTGSTDFPRPAKVRPATPPRAPTAPPMFGEVLSADGDSDDLPPEPAFDAVFVGPLESLESNRRGVGPTSNGHHHPASAAPAAATRSSSEIAVSSRADRDQPRTNGATSGPAPRERRSRSRLDAGFDSPVDPRRGSAAAEGTSSDPSIGNLQAGLQSSLPAGPTHPTRPAEMLNTFANAPAAAFTGELAFSDANDEEAATSSERPPRRRLGGLLLIGGAVVVAVLAGLVLADTPEDGVGIADRVARWWQGSGRDRADALIGEARRAADLDTDAGRTRALELLDEARSADGDDPAITAERAYVLAESAMALDRAALRLETDARALDDRLEGWRTAVQQAQERRRPLPPRPEAPDPDRYRLEARQRRSRADEVLAEVKRLVDRAERLAPTRIESKRAHAAYLLALGHLDALEAKLGSMTVPAGAFDPHLAYLEAAGVESDVGNTDAQTLERARGLLRQAIATRPTFNRARVLLARLLMDDDQAEAAGAVLSPVLASAPNHPEAQAVAEARAQAPAEAPSPAPPSTPPPAVETRAAPKPRLDYDGWLARAHRHRRSGRVKAALDAYGRASKLDESSAEPHAGKGWCYIDLERPRVALLAFDRAIRLNERLAEAYFGRGEAHLAVGDRPAALEAYRAYLTRAPANAEDRPIATQKIARLEAALSTVETSTSS